jgi:Hint domain
VTASGERRPIVWIGHRAIDCCRHANPKAVQPVRVAAHAFAENQPVRDLWLSPGHSVAVDGVLIPICFLVNGRSIEQIATAAIEYWHVELDAHDVMLAEGLPTESYLDAGNRTAFANGGSFVEAHPDFSPKHWAATCLPLVKQSPAVARTKLRLLARLADEGYCVNQEADVHIVVDGLRVEPIRLSETRHAFVLPVGGRKIDLRSNVFVPAHTVAVSSDPRELGLCVRELQIDGSVSALRDDERWRSGWHEAEFAGSHFTHRWTTGSTSLPTGARIAIVDLAGVGYYWRDSKENVGAMFA